MKGLCHLGQRDGKTLQCCLCEKQPSQAHLGMRLLTTFASVQPAVAHASVVATSRASAVVVTAMEAAHAAIKVFKRSKLSV